MKNPINILLFTVLLAGSNLARAEEGGDDMVLSPRGKPAQAKAADAANPADSTDKMAGSLRVTGMWLVLLGLGSGALMYIARKRGVKPSGAASEKRLEVVERISLGGQRELLLVKVCDRMLVVASQANQMTLLSDLPTDTSPTQPFAAYTGELDSTPNALQNRISQEYGVDMQERIAVANVTAPAAVSSNQTKATMSWPDRNTLGSLS
jgi:flagellar biogenesis protein FliO